MIPQQDRTGVPSDRTGLGYPPPPPPRQKQNSRASTCYAAGGTPLGVTQEDFLV